MNLEKILLLLQTLHFILARAVFALNIKKEKIMEAFKNNEEGKTFKHFFTLKPSATNGNFYTRVIKNLSQKGDGPWGDLWSSSLSSSSKQSGK